MLNFYSIIIQDSSCSQNKNFEWKRLENSSLPITIPSEAKEIYLFYKNGSGTNYKYSGILPFFMGQYWCTNTFYIEIDSNRNMYTFKESVGDVMYPATSVTLYYR